MSISTAAESLNDLMTKDRAFLELQKEMVSAIPKKGKVFIIESGKQVSLKNMKKDPKFVEIDLDASESDQVQQMLNKLVVGSVGSSGRGLSLKKWRKKVSGKKMSQTELLADLKQYSKAWNQHMNQRMCKSGTYRDLESGKCIELPQIVLNGLIFS